FSHAQVCVCSHFFFGQAEDCMCVWCLARGLGDVDKGQPPHFLYKKQQNERSIEHFLPYVNG
ncbi:hypothetical protein, partial [Salmonella enterica]|uniref:hypothetical protein n=1 Tax=Salmonella enterica TaxID=28901 RepID=UPI001C62F1E5